MKKVVYTAVILLAITFGIQAQNTTTESQVENTTSTTVKKTTPKKVKPPVSGLEGSDLSLKEQFDYVLTKSESYQSYKVVKSSSLNKLKTNSLDSIQIYKKQIIELQEINNNHEKNINKLNNTLTETKDNLSQITNEKDSFSFMGMLMLKGSYSTMMWLIVLALVIVIATLIFLFKRSSYITAKTKESLNDKQEELDSHRKWALEREQTLARELNKLKQKYKGLE